MTHLLRTLVVGVVAALGWAVWLRVDDTLSIERRALIVETQRADELAEQLHEAEATIDDLATALAYVKVDTRRARLTVLEQTSAPRVSTRVRFVEIDADGETVSKPIETELPGRVAYIESLVIKFDDSHVEAGDPWRGTSLCLFRRMFCENQRPEEGVSLDPEGQEPPGYADADARPSDALWRRFWDYADDPQAAAEQGVRALHGEAPFIELRAGRSYLVELRAAGGLSIRRELP